MKIYQKLHEIQKHVRGLGKDEKSFGYQYVSGSKVLSVIRPLMDEHGLLLKQEVISIDNERMDYRNKKGESKSEILTKALMRFTWVDVETGEKDINDFAANGQNDWEKGLGSALTYAERYFLLKYFHIATDEDDIDNPERKPEEPTQPPNEEPKAVTKQPKKTKLTKEKYEELKEKGTKKEILNVLDTYEMSEQARKLLKQALEIAK